MATDAFKLEGSYSIRPLSAPTSFAPEIGAPISETRNVKAVQQYNVTLTSDSPAAVAFGGVANAHLVILKSLSGKVRARLTSADGTAQAIPFDTYLILFSESVPITAIDLTRQPAVETMVRIFLAEKA